MGQYFMGIILGEKPEKGEKEVIRVWAYPWHGSGGIKLTEHAYQNNPFMNAFENLIQPYAMFYKSRIVWTGDYAPVEDVNPRQNLYTRCLDENKNDEKYITKVGNFSIERPSDIVKYPFIVNHTKKEYVDKRKVAKCYFAQDESRQDIFQIHPLPILTAEGNGKGSGDYRGTDMELVGRWARDTISMEIQNPNDSYTELPCKFIQEYTKEYKWVGEDE